MDTAANVRLLSPQLIKTESSFHLSGLFWFAEAGGGSGPAPGASCVDGWREEKMYRRRENLVDAGRKEWGRRLNGFMAQKRDRNKG